MLSFEDRVIPTQCQCAIKNIIWFKIRSEQKRHQFKINEKKNEIKIKNENKINIKMVMKSKKY